MVACRKINDEFNILNGVFDNYMYVLIFLVICIGQGIIVEFGDVAMKCSKGGLPW